MGSSLMILGADLPASTNMLGILPLDVGGYLVCVAWLAPSRH
jgi:hypothetical protein